MKLEIITVEDKQVTFDVSMLMKEEAVMINATHIANQFGKRVQHWLDAQDTQDYINAVARKMSKTESRLQQKLSSDEISQNGNSHIEELVRVQHGGKYSGTWIHSKLAIQFARWLNADFAVECDEAISRLIRGEQQRKEERLKARTGYAPLTLAIQSSHEEPKFYHFSNEANLINRIVLGMDAKEFKEANSVDKVRDVLTVEQLAHIDALQSYDTHLVELGYEYNERKDMLMAYYTKRLEKNGRLYNLQRKALVA